MRPYFTIPEYHAYLSPDLARSLLDKCTPVGGVERLLQVGENRGLETSEALTFLADLYQAIEKELKATLARRTLDRIFIDQRVRSLSRYNTESNIELSSTDYQTVIGLEDADGRIVFGPKTNDYHRAGSGRPIAPLPDFLKGPHVTLFGPPDSAKLSINAMNAYHRRLPNEPVIIEELLKRQPYSPMWGADDEDSKTPIRADLVDAALNLTACHAKTLRFQEGQKSYQLADNHLALPIKRFPGLALPCTFLFFGENPIPLHLYDFALHLFQNWSNPKALVFYVPKLENEEEAKYIRSMISEAETRIKKIHPSYKLGTVRVIVVLENPRAILRVHEIMDELYPYFAGASLGWHDYLASTARLLKNDPNYRIPVKADPNIVIKYIKASHLLLAQVVGSRGGIKIGGMYGILPVAENSESLQITLRGFFKDVITQLKRDLDGFWVAHPDFVRIGLALVQAWTEHRNGDSTALNLLIDQMIDSRFSQEIHSLVQNPDTDGFDLSSPKYVRSLIVADIQESDFIPNHHPDEVRYNVFQSLQYLTDWLSGNGCVALPTIIDSIPVRVMDDLATAERSRWEVWHEIKNNRISLVDFVQIAQEEMNFIRRDLSNDTKIVQVKWDERTEKWFPIAYNIMLKLMTDPDPVEFASELLLPFTVHSIRSSDDPWVESKLRIDTRVSRLNYYFEICGNVRFAQKMAENTLEDLKAAQSLIESFSIEEIKTAASFHGDFGQKKSTLDHRAKSEQATISTQDEETLLRLRTLGQDYLRKFGFKFLLSAMGKSTEQVLAHLEFRLQNDLNTEITNARAALFEISRRRMGLFGSTKEDLQKILDKYSNPSLSITINGSQTFFFSEGQVKAPRYQLASLSKVIGSAFALEYFAKNGIPLDSKVNLVLAQCGSSYRLTSTENSSWGDRVTLRHLLDHTALNMHYVYGHPPDQDPPNSADLLKDICVISEPGKKFRYSGGGFVLLEYILEQLEKKPISKIIEPFTSALGLKSIQAAKPASVQTMSGTYLQFPALAAGLWGTTQEMSQFLIHLSTAFRNQEGSGSLSHDTAVQMLHSRDLGSQDFMGCKMGLGIFTLEGRSNRFAVHQGANDGYRALFIHCYDGPDVGKGFVVCCTGNNESVLLIAEVAELVLKALDLKGVDLNKLGGGVDFKGLPQEQIVNLGYKKLIFEAFEPDLPDAINYLRERDPLADRNLVVGAKVVSVTNQRFAQAENLLSPFLPHFDPEHFCAQGKVMDSWETVRHNPFEFDSLILDLLGAMEVRYLLLSTQFHDGNHPEFVKILGSRSIDESVDWLEILPKTHLEGHSILKIDLIKSASGIRRLRIDMYPDGGLTRLGLYSDLSQPDASYFRPLAEAKSIRLSAPIPKAKKPLTIPFIKGPTRNSLEPQNWACLSNGGKVMRVSNEHYGPASQVISPFPPIHMFDGFESARSRDANHSEELVLKLGKPTLIEQISLDFSYFVNNNPVAISIFAKEDSQWVEIQTKTDVKAYAGNIKTFKISYLKPAQELLFKIFPDGGINRIKVMGQASPA